MSDLIEVKETLQIKPIDTKDFYADPNSIYIKITYVKAVDGFKCEVKNEILEKYTPDTVPEEVLALGRLVRGMVEITLANAGELCKIGQRAQNAEMIDGTDMEDGHRNLLLQKPMGNA